MKNNLFRKFLAVFLTGTLLGAVGCKDYDDDINDLKGQIDDLKGKIELKADASALSSLQQKLEGINFDDFVKDAELDKMVKDLGYQTAEDVKALIPEGMSTEDVKNIFDAQIKALDTWGEIESNIGKAVKEYLAGSEYTTAQQNQIVNTILKQIDPTAQDIKTAIKNVLGTEFGGYMEEYMTKDDFRGSLDEAAAELLKKENGKLAAGIAEMISSEGFLEQAGLKEKFEGYDAAIKSLRSDVDALIAQIQSLVYVPEALDGQVVMAAYKVGDTELEKGDLSRHSRQSPRRSRRHLCQEPRLPLDDFGESDRHPRRRTGIGSCRRNGLPGWRERQIHRYDRCRQRDDGCFGRQQQERRSGTLDPEPDQGPGRRRCR